MRPDQPPTIRLADYRPHPYPVRAVHLTFALDPEATEVTSVLSVEPTGSGDLIYDGIDLKLISLALNGAPLPEAAYTVGAETLTIAAAHLPDTAFELTIITRIAPVQNTALEGLYMSKGMYCTQCEAEGFRKITYFPDRPDVMATYTVRIEGDAPVMLSNGNPTASGDGWAEWHDPWPKPAYLFALVAGDLVSHDDRFTTMSGRQVTLRIFVRPGDEDRCAYAMDALKRSMRWDEEAYGREYDLDLFMIVAVDDFNMGAMENKGLNVFNSKYVLASPETATDRDYEFIEGIVAHEYFHNWTGNRITCRDWFQLCLKEGLTVFRDQQFSADQRSAPVKRIDDVLSLRARQFREDAGPLAHPVRPEEYIEINNFYTATVYDKGAEVIGMLRTLVGAEAYRSALDLYFERHDGQACTIEDWITVFEDATGRDLGQFARWYSQAGTPRVSVTEHWDGEALTLTATQTTPPTPGQPDKQPLVIPLDTGVLWPDGSEALPTRTLELTQDEQSFRLPLTPPPGGLAEGAAPIASLNRGFSAPIILETRADDAQRRFLLAHDTDPFNRWEAGRMLLRGTLGRMARDAAVAPDRALLDALIAVLDDDSLDPAFKAFALGLPSIDDIFHDLAETGPAPDPLAIREAITRFDTAFAQAVPDLPARLSAAAVPGPYRPTAEDAGKRALAARLLSLQTRLEPEAGTARAAFAAAGNMTETISALSLLIREGQAEEALSRFYDRWKADAGVLDKWFAVQASLAPPDAAPETATALLAHGDFDWRTPNRVRSVIGAFAMGNLAGFHRADGAGYALLGEAIATLDPINPQTTARLAGAFETWRKFDEDRQALMLKTLQAIADRPGLSKDTGEIVGRILEAR